MLRRFALLTTVMVAMTAYTGTASARDELASIVVKDKLSQHDSATINTVVERRVKSLVDADSATELKDARAELIATSKIKRATKAGLEAYARACSDELATPVLNERLGLALESVLVLTEFENAETASALSGALRSRHVSVRYMAARGIQKLHADLAKQASDCKAVLRALAKAGETEQNELALRMIYEAINFKDSVSDFKHQDVAAESLSRILARRVDALRRHSHDEWFDRQAYGAAADCYPGAKAGVQRELMKSLVGLMANHVDRYCSDATAKESAAALADLIKELESSIHRILQSASVSPPANRLSSHAKASPSRSSKKGMKAAMSDLKGVVSGPPWNIP